MSGTIRLLVIADDERDAARLEGAMSARAGASFEVRLVRDLPGALQAVDDDRFDAALLDLSPERGRGLDALVRLHERAPDLPIIVLTGEEDEALAMRALKAGAQDSLVSGAVDGALLVRAIRYAIERHQLQVALHAMSLVDDLTGLYNRRGFLTLARQQLKTADRMRKRMSQIFVDLDGLKAINDTFGHREGDRALIETADLLKETFRESDIIARIGGDEFVVLAMETAGVQPEQWAHRLHENLRARNRRPDRHFPLSLSMGITYYDPDFPCAIVDLLDRADSLMYQQKRNKRVSRPATPTSLDPPSYGLDGAPGLARRAD